MASTINPSTLSGISAGFDSVNTFDDTAFGDSLGLDDDPLFSPDWDLQDTPPYNGLYSTPLSWDPPETKQAIKAQVNQPMAYPTMNTLTQAQEEKLRSIAMPQTMQYSKDKGGSPNSTTSTYKSNSISSPEHAEPSRKRKSSAEADDDEDEDSNGQHPPVKKTAHNMIEKRYRTNLNDKIAALRDSVPSLRIMSKSARGEDTADDREDLQGLTPAHKLNKATVLSKATEYIRHLEKRNNRLSDENAAMKARINAFEKLFMAGSMGFSQVPPISNTFQFSQEYSTPGPSPLSDPQGMIQVPEDIRRLHASQLNQQTYAVPQEYHQQVRQPMGSNGWQAGGSYFGKLMVGSLAGLMIMEGFSEAEQDTDTPGARGLFAIPTKLLSTVSKTLHSSADISVLGYHVPAAQTLGYMKLFLILGALVYAFLPSVFTRKPKEKADKVQINSLSPAPSLASSIQVRRRAWLTSIQTVWVPQHNFFLEAAALLLKMMKLSIRNAIGSGGYSLLTGMTEEQEAGRRNAWTIALDAQLAGGDVEVSKSRLTLTLLASGTLPDTPTRLMLKALHIRVLLWEVGNSGFNSLYMFQELAAKLARWKWNEAKQLHRVLAHQKRTQEEELPEHLAALLEQECDDVLIDSIGQRAYNLAWNLPTTHNTEGSSDGMNGVVDDFAIKSPLDAIAAWWSSLVLQRALSASLEVDSDPESEESICKNVTLAIKTAPIGSGAQIRALVTRAVLTKEKRGANIAAALQALGPWESPKLKSEGEVPTFINTRTSTATLPDIHMSLRCAMAIAHLERFPAPANPVAAHRIINSIMPMNMSLLGFTAAFRLMEALNDHELAAGSCSVALERLAGNLRIWIGGDDGVKCGLGREVKRSAVERCLAVTKRVVGMEPEGDDGYGTMSDDDGEGC
ncbi:helix-loop-helix DNA-binding protein [Coleophoma cylindrospora]|uniref:Helix-loop-helix DNA-binding protein n=1 Tax=Coleophoma cylindrospora TaxID=1849047 RepID=A0A3D8QXM5_9HELO|nr:helix-loop-helix DNA-binding protein [Coleophoma cylindrospora]